MAFYTNRISFNISMYSCHGNSQQCHEEKHTEQIGLKRKKACADTLTNLTMQTEQYLYVWAEPLTSVRIMS